MDDYSLLVSKRCAEERADVLTYFCLIRGLSKQTMIGPHTLIVRFGRHHVGSSSEGPVFLSPGVCIKRMDYPVNQRNQYVPSLVPTVHKRLSEISIDFNCFR